MTYCKFERVTYERSMDGVPTLKHRNPTDDLADFYHILRRMKPLCSQEGNHVFQVAAWK